MHGGLRLMDLENIFEFHVYMQYKENKDILGDWKKSLA